MVRRALMWSMVAAGTIFVAAAPGPPPLEIAAREMQDQAQRPTELILVLTNGAYHPKLGVQEFQSSDPALKEAASTVAEVLWADLDFEREFSMIPRKNSLALPVAGAPEALPYDQWRALGAEFVLTGSIRATGQEFEVDLRLISVRPDSPGTQAFASVYEHCTGRNPRRCAHAIADDFHKKTRGLDGVARTRLAFSSDRDGARMLGRPDVNPGQAKEIYISDYDGANQQRFTANQSINIHAVWSPTGGLLAFSSYVSGVPDIYVANWAQPGRALMRPANGNDRIQNFCPAMSPDGSKIAFMSNRSGDMEIWVVNTDGTGLTNLTNSPRSYETTPTWSPTGAQIAFVSDRSGQPKIYWMTANGTGIEVLTSERGDRPTWSREGFIAFTAGQAPGSDIAIFDVTTRRTRILTDGLGTNGSPSVSPNGRHIAFVTSRWGKEQVAIIDQDGKNIRRITEAGNNTYPNWQPITGGR